MYSGDRAGSSSFQVVLCPEMPNDEVASTAELRHEATNGDIGDTASSSSFPRLDFEFKECKTEPGLASEDLSEFDRFSTNHEDTLDIPVLEPVVLLEKCDKIWETLQLIKTMQRASPTTMDEDEEEEGDEEKGEEEKEDEKVAPSSNKTEQTLSIKSPHKSTNDSKTPFQFSVQKTRRLYPCVTCGKQYLEKRSLRKHALRIHGIVIPVKFRRTKKPRITNMHDLNKNNGTALFHKGNSNSEKLCNKSLHGKITISNYLKKSQNAFNVNSSNDQSENVDTFIPEKGQYNTCALCRQKVKCLKKHLINYHKIGCSANMLKQLETSLVVESGSSSSGSGKPTLKDILSGKPPETSVHKSMQNKSHTVDSEEKSRVTSQVPQKRKYTLSYVSTKKRYKLNNGRYVPVQNTSKFAQVPNTSKFTQVRVKYLSKNKYKCDICLGVYSSPNCLAKHKRIHASRGETKDNFHKFECKYFNSPLSKRYQEIMSSVKPADTAVKNENNGLDENIEPSDAKVSGQDQKISTISRAATHKNMEKESNNCVCGRSFRTSHILRIHKDNCKLYNQEDKAAQHSIRDEYSSDRDSGIGINITIKKRNNSYEIVGKDGEEDKPTDHIADGVPSSNVSQDGVENVTEANTEQQQPGENETSNYSKNHSVLKLEDVDEDMIIDIESDEQLLSNRKGKQTVVRRDNKSSLRMRQNGDAGDAKENNTPENVPTLKEMCQEVLKKNSTLQKPEENVTTTQLEKKRNLRSVSTSHSIVKMEEEEYVEPEVSMAMNFDPMTCAYCCKNFNTINMYNKHQCTIDEGRQFDEYSLNLLCFCCNETLDSCSQFDEHMKTEHYDRAYHCYLCPEKFSSRKLRNKHTNTQHDTSCKFCHMDIPLWILNLHEAYHLGVGYPCHKCKKAYANRKNLSYHNTTIHKSGVDNMIFCNLCLRSVKLKSFRSHMSAHDLSKCHFCGKEFIDRTGIEYHTLIHHGGTFSKLKCNDCGTRFWTKRQLEQHKKTGRCGTIKRMREESNTAKNTKHC